MKRFIFLLLGLLLIFVVFYKSSITSRGAERPLNEELVNFLQEYIRIDTTHPKPAYDKALNFLEKHAEADSFIFKRVPLPSGNTVGIITYIGTNPTLPSLALNHHMDVVPANPEGWISDPFAAEIHDGNIIGRGTQDMKGIGATHYFALKELKKQGYQPKRTIHIFAVPDEEVGGFKGTKEFVMTQAFKELNIGAIVDEGHASGIESALDIKVGERKPIQIEITALGELAHGSHLACHNAVHTLVKMLSHMTELHEQQQNKMHSLQAGQLLSCNITSLTAGIKKENGHIALNMVPDTAKATIDIRVPPTMKKQQVIALLDKLVSSQKNLSYKILAQADEEPECGDYQTPLYKTLSHVLEKMNLDAQPHYFEASSDLRFYQALGIDGIGFTPFTVTDNIHGVNESVPVSQLIRGKDITVQLIKDFCS